MSSLSYFPLFRLCHNSLPLNELQKIYNRRPAVANRLITILMSHQVRNRSGLAANWARKLGPHACKSMDIPKSQSFGISSCEDRRIIYEITNITNIPLGYNFRLFIT
ncbi:hypothetical protein TNIN_40511 [Trichonephila inaurata madagascariensis]|uniref:Uncharacterized protein n=1 Tax=Trichonephila inaurata madagascariensis TaxID=2747483 RepID=A0A8X7C9S7_9ARAC|nr:hypothetical protein TNIN_40511 [Trichonephila inaurata madagascariensis]